METFAYRAQECGSRLEVWVGRPPDVGAARVDATRAVLTARRITAVLYGCRSCFA
ncbi:hypothetical protein GCM10010994_04430 [Chelatococcus reniformis]|uniref:Uncharacterized protein n=1 Tax=Chelatococcus reniformis TaxID=1494448 RepID=A0A916TXQ6_9HYPH|nr:hypothetical protein GCM10010994_04430 [Chelatococcus reniformis]